MRARGPTLPNILLLTLVVSLLPHHVDAQETCTDKAAACASWASLGECTKNPGYMNTACAKSCNQCGDAATDTEPTPTQEAASVTEPPPKVAKAKNPLCARWVQKGECKKSADFMAAECPEECAAAVDNLSAKATPPLKPAKARRAPLKALRRRATAIFGKRPFPGVRKALVRMRLTAFTSEVGESFRPIIRRWLVLGSYGVSWLYVFTDIAIQGFEAADNTAASACSIRRRIVRASIFHTIATMLVPAVTVHTVVQVGTALIKKLAGLPAWFSWMPTAVGIGIIPLLVLLDRPFEHLLDKLMKHLPACKPNAESAAHKAA